MTSRMLPYVNYFLFMRAIFQLVVKNSDDHLHRMFEGILFHMERSEVLTNMAKVKTAMQNIHLEVKVIFLGKLYYLEI